MLLTAGLLAQSSAMAFAVSTVVQHRAATKASVPPGKGMALRLALRLLRARAWLAGQLAAVIGFVLHGAALHNGPVVLVQPILSGGLVLALALGWVVDRRHPDRPLPDRRQWLSAAVVVVGLVTFLVSAAPRHGRPHGRPGILVGGVAVALCIALASWAYSRRSHRPHRALALGIAAGCGFGMTGVLLKQVVHRLPRGWEGVWPLLLLILIGGTSIVCAQSAYQAGKLIESLPTMTVLEPVVAIMVASHAYEEVLASGWLAHVGQVVGLLVLATGVVGIARAENTREALVADEVFPLP